MKPGISILLSIQNNMKGKKYILASGSPRRKELMSGLDLDFVVETGTDCDENYDENMPLDEIPEYLSSKKSDAFHRELEKDEVLITADTMVLCEDRILGKPHDREEAIRMLKLLSNRTHRVLTGVTLRSSKKRKSFTATTTVTFRELEDSEILYFIDRYKPFDKAGAYAVQEWIGYIGITSIQGSFFNVMGLPVQRLYDELKKL